MLGPLIIIIYVQNTKIQAPRSLDLLQLFTTTVYNIYTVLMLKVLMIIPNFDNAKGRDLHTYYLTSIDLHN